MKTKKLISLLASCSLAASSFIALCTTALAANEPVFTITIDKVSADDFNNSYSSYSDDFNWYEYNDPNNGVNYQTYSIKVAASGMELTAETKTITVNKKKKTILTGQSVGGATLFTEISTNATKGDDYNFAVIDSLVSVDKITKNLDGTTYKASYSGNTPLYPTIESSTLSINKDHSFNVFEYLLTVDTSKELTLKFDSAKIIYNSFDDLGNVVANSAIQESAKVNNDTLTFGVTKPVITVTPDKAEMILGNTVELVASNDQDAKLTYTYKSSSDKIATVDVNGVVKAVGEGSATITVSAEGATSAECTINVRKATVGEDFTPTELGKKIKFIGMELLGVDSSDKYVYITKDGKETRKYDKTIGEILGGVWGEGASVDASLAIGIITADESSVFSFEIKK